MKKQFARTAIALRAVTLCADVAAQACPAKAVRWIVPYPPGGTPEQAGAFFRSEMAKWSKIAQAAGLKPE